VQAILYNAHKMVVVVVVVVVVIVVVVVVVVVLEVVVVIFMQSPVTLSPSTFFLNLCRKSNTNSNTDSSPQWKSGRSY